MIERARPVKRANRYQYVRAQSAVFRYDNAPHHPQLPVFPHHKHVGRKMRAATEPTLQQVLQEISALLPNTSASEPSARPRKSRPRARRQ